MLCGKNFQIMIDAIVYCTTLWYLKKNPHSCTEKFWILSEILIITSTYLITQSHDVMDMDKKTVSGYITCVYGCYDAELYLKVSMVVIIFFCLWKPIDTCRYA